MKAKKLVVPVVGMGFMGVLFAYLLEQMYDNAFIIDTVVTESITLPELQAAVILVWIIAGFLIGIVR